MSQTTDYKSLIKLVFDYKQRQILGAENQWKIVETNKNVIPVGAVAMIVRQLYSEIRNLNDLVGLLIQVAYTQNDDIQLFRQSLIDIHSVLPLIIRELSQFGKNKNIVQELKQLDSRIVMVERESSKRKELLFNLDSTLKKKVKQQQRENSRLVPDFEFFK